MSVEEYKEGCPGCKPILLDLETMKPLPDDHPIMVAAMEVWKDSTFEERKAFHDVMCNNSRTSENLRVAEGLTKRMMPHGGLRR